MGPSDESDEVPPSTYIVAAVLGLSFVGCLIYLLSLIWRVLASILPASKLRHKPAPAASSSAPVRSTGQAATQAPPQAPGVSMKTLLKQAKAGQGRAAAQDKATHHPLYLNTLKGHGGNVSGLDVSLDGGAIATAADDRTVRVYRLEDAISKNNNFKHKVVNAEPVDVAFGADSSQVAVLSKGGLDAANVSMLGPNPSSGGGPLQTLWEVPNCHGSQAAIGLHSGLRCGGPHGLLMTCSEKSDMRLFSLSGKLLAVVEPSGLQNHMASLSLDARFFAAATFTSDVKVHEAKFDKHGEFQGTTKVMDLKGHKSQVLVMAFSRDSTRAMTASKDGTYKLWSLDVRYQLNEDAKCLYTRDQQAPKGSLWKHMVMMDNDTFAAAWDSTVQFINASTGQVTATIEQAHEGPISYMQFAGSKMKAGDESVHVLLTAAQKQVRLWRAPKGAARCTAVRP